MVFKTNYNLMKVKREHSALLSTFIMLPFVKTFVLSILGWPLKTGFTVLIDCSSAPATAAVLLDSAVMVGWGDDHDVILTMSPRSIFTNLKDPITLALSCTVF